MFEVKKEALSEMKEHKKLIEKGRPDDVPPGFRFRTVSGMYGICKYIQLRKSSNTNWWNTLKYHTFG